MFTGITHELDINVTQSQIDAWEGGQHIQHAMPQLTADEREFIKTGITAEEWAEAFPPEEDEQ